MLISSNDEGHPEFVDGVIRSPSSEAFKASLPPLFLSWPPWTWRGKKAARTKDTVPSEKPHSHLGGNGWTGFEKVVGLETNAF